MRQAFILATVFLMLRVPVHAAEVGAKPTVYIDNLHSCRDYIFYVYLSGGNLDPDSEPFGMRWSRIELGNPIRFPAARKVTTFSAFVAGQADQVAVLFAVPRHIWKEAEGLAHPEWFAAGVAGILPIGELPLFYTRDDWFGQRSKTFHYRLELVDNGFSLLLVSENDDYDLSDLVFAIVFCSPLTLVILLVVVAGMIVLFLRVWKRKQRTTNA